MNSSANIKVGLLGAGYILDAHAKALQAAPGAELHAVCDLSAARAKAAAQRYGVGNSFTSLEALIESDVDAVHVLLPPALHFDAARRLLEAGKHVFIEKPMALSAANCASLTALARTRGVRLGVNHNFLFLPAYEELRDAVRAGQLGAIDHLTVNWLYAMPMLQFGPFDNWMVAEPRNIMFEFGAHIASFAVDLLGAPDTLTATVANPIDLPGGKRVYRHITVSGGAGRAALVLNLSVTPGQADRSLRLRGTGGVAQLDFERDLAWIEQSSHANPIIDNFRAGRSIAGAIGKRTRQDFGRYLKNTIRKAPAPNPFEESIVRSVAAFYGQWGGEIDPRLSGEFGTQVIALCEQAAAHVPSGAKADQLQEASSYSQPARILVIGGTGFIGRRLVEKLVEQGHRVRVLTRSLSSARALLPDDAVELVQGSHGNADVLAKALDGIETVYHLAKAEGSRWEDYVRNDIEPTRKLAEAALQAGVKRFIYTGTIDSYASARAQDVITSDTPLDPQIASRNFYARSKAACEALLNDMHRTKGLPVVIFRPGIVIGEGSPPAHWGVGRFNSLTDVDYWGEGSHPLPFVLVDDVADALVRALDAPGIEGETFLLTDAPMLSARDYVREVGARLGSAIAARAVPIWRLFADDAAKEALKHAIKHPKRRRPSYHDWACRSHRSRYDSAKTRERLGWSPAGDRQTMIDQGIHAAVDRFMR